MNNEIKQLAFRAGIQIDAFGSPVVDHERILQAFAESIIKRSIELAEGVKKSEIKATVNTAFGLK